MITLLKNLILLSVLFVAGLPVQAAVIDTSTITVNASGSLNTISGFGSIDDFLVIPNNATFDYFTVELSEFTTDPSSLGLPQSLSLEFRYFDPFSTGNICWNLNTDIFVGKTLTVSSSENSAAFDKMQGFIAGLGVDAPQIYSTMAWGFGGVDGTATANFLVTAHGDISPVPEPATIWLMGAGLLSILSFQIRKKRTL